MKEKKEDISMGDWDDPNGLDMDWQRFDAGLKCRVRSLV